MLTKSNKLIKLNINSTIKTINIRLHSTVLSTVEFSTRDKYGTPENKIYLINEPQEGQIPPFSKNKQLWPHRHVKDILNVKNTGT